MSQHPMFELNHEEDRLAIVANLRQAAAMQLRANQQEVTEEAVMKFVNIHLGAFSPEATIQSTEEEA